MIKQSVVKQSEIKQHLLQHPDLWRAGQLAAQQGQTQRGINTGYDLLDQHLPQQGWPQAGLVEFLLASAGVGELRLLVPALQALSQSQHRWLAWINPPFIPYAPALEAVGIDVGKVLLIHPQSHQDTLWSIERACKSATCSCVMAWPDEKKLRLKDTQRLQVAAKQGNTFTCLFRPPTARLQASMAELRLELQAAVQPGVLQLNILKRRGGWPLNNLQLSVAAATHTQHRQQQEIQEQLHVWRAQRALAAAEPSIQPDIHLPGQLPIQPDMQLSIQSPIQPPPHNAENLLH